MESFSQAKQTRPAYFEIRQLDGTLTFAGVCALTTDQFTDDEMKEYERIAFDLDRLLNRITFRHASARPVPTLDLSPVQPFSADALRQLGS